MSVVRLAARAVTVSALGFALVPVLGASPAYACSCIQSTEQENFQRADVVFRGTVDDALATNDQFGERVFVFTPSKVYKGKAVAPQKVSTAGNSAACGVVLNGAGPFLVFANKSDDAKAKAPLSTSLCSGTREIKAGEEPDFKATKTVKVDEGAREPVAPDANPDRSVSSDDNPVVPLSGDAADTPLMQTTGIASDNAAAENVKFVDDVENRTNYVPFAATVAAVGAVVVAGATCARRRR